MKGGSIWTFAVVALVLALALVGTNVAYQNAAESELVDRNTTVDYGQKTTFSIDAFEVTDNETVTNATGTTLAEGTDYEWFPANQTLEWFNTTATADGDNATLTVEVRRHEQAETITKSILATASSWVGFLLLIIAAGWVLNVALGGGF